MAIVNAVGAKPFYLALAVFVFSQLVAVLWPRHYLLASRNIPSATPWFSKRSLDIPAPDIQCEDVWSHPDRCAFVEQYCGDYPAGLINYLHFYFCDLGHIPPLAIAILTGVTFLAFGNGSPDVFSTFSAMGAGSGSLAIGELVGAASFITSVVVGSMAIIKPFKVSRAPFLRDVIFFAGCVLFTLYTVVDGKITFFESVFLIVYYVIYVSSVVLGNWWHQRAKSERELEECARNLYENDDDDEESLLLDEEQALLGGSTSRIPKPPRINTLIATGPYDDYEDEEHDDGYISPGGLSANDLDHYDSNQTLVNSYDNSDVNTARPHLSNDSGGVEDSISLRPPGSSALKRRPSLLSAFEFNDVVRSLTLSGSRGRIASYDPSYYGTKSPRSPRTPRRQSSGSPSTHVPDFGSRPASLHSQTSGSHLRPPSIHSDVNVHLSVSPVPTDPDMGHFDAHFEQALLRHSLILPDHHDPSNQHLGHVHPQLHGQANLDKPSPTTISQKILNFWSVIMPIYFPTLLNWNEKSAFVKFLAVTSIPMVLLLTLTLPVVDLKEDEDDEDDEDDEESIEVDTDPDAPQPPKITIIKAEPESRYDGWSRTATTVQMFLVPIFIAAVVSSAAEEGYIAIPLALCVGAVLSFLIRRFSTEELPPRFYGALCFVGFLVAITWIFLVANEVVGILQAFGMIFGVSDAILGLTIFAMGNSLGDLVANITIARMGFPRMAFSACFGGPLLNMLLGVGISGTYMTIKTGTHIPLELSPTLFVSLIGVLLTLCAAIIIVPRNGYMMDRNWGWFLLIVYTLCTIANVVIEIKTNKSDH
ncbi:hypothetical protein BG011_006859 [Mortierella polycephala]|uniref:Sodium/calcium exchanger membrane region domain-containing protein n=1 Tax=Mortierella polycephala TaxID=41804 RepID=A0A9P6PTW2_9FUNG|nr:hypothetical protein BG011_006859 [Mortierella polycephala]